jgi:hypothetical protein
LSTAPIKDWCGSEQLAAKRSTNMSDLTLAIIFRNPRPKRSPIDNELYLLRSDGSSSRIHYSDKGELNQVEVLAGIKRFALSDGTLN